MERNKKEREMLLKESKSSKNVFKIRLGEIFNVIDERKEINLCPKSNFRMV